VKRALLITGLLSLPVLAQEVIFDDGFDNHDPVIVSSPVTTASLGTPYGYDVNAADIDGDTLLYLLTTAPAGMTMDPASGLIEWTPNTLGTYPVAVDVSDGLGGSAVQAWDLEVLEIVDSDHDGLSDDDEILLGTDPDDPDTDDDGVLDGAEVFTYNTDPLDPDSDDDTFLDGSELAVGTDPLDPDDYPIVPPDPATVAPNPDLSITGNARDNTAFLYSGVDPIQTGVAPDTIEIKRAALLRGRVLTRLGAPLPAVTVSIMGHPEFGSTLSRADGMFDLAVNGGAPLTIDYQREGYLPSQRTLELHWQEYLMAPDVALIPLDPVMTPVDLAAPGDMKVARGSMQSDGDGNRQATILFPAGVGAELRMADDSTMPISNLSVRATEFTVGDSGEMAMPGALPPTSGYTYAVELSVDEAMAMGATSVDFDQPLPFYVENFLGFPAGTPVPTGYYDRNRGAWVPAPDGLVIKIVSENGGMADIDVDGDDVADTGAPLSELDITDAERIQIASLYAPGQSLWRVPVEHFTSWDHNWPIGPPPDATYPEQPRPYSDYSEYGMCEIGGSIIECQNQVVREKVPVTGTPFTLNYSSARVPDRKSARHVEIPLTDNDNPASLKQVRVRVAVAGQVYDFSYDPVPGLVQPLTWDGLDAFGREVQGTSTANVHIGYVYEGVYRSGGSGPASFGQPGQLPIIVEGNRTRADFVLPQEYHTAIGAWDARGQGLGGWTLSVHHAYDPVNKILYRGDGSKRGSEHIPKILGMAAGLLDEDGYAIECWDAGQFPGCGDGLPASEATLDFPGHVAFGPDGSMYITEQESNRVRRIRPDGIIENFAGTGESYVNNEDGSLFPNGDGGPALDAKLTGVYSIAVDAQGNVYIGEASFNNKRIRKVDTNGIITTYAGVGMKDQGIYPPNGPALEVRVWPLGLEVDDDGNLYVVDICHVFRIDTAGHSSVIAGDTDECGNFGGDGGPAILAGLSAEGLDLGPDGSIYVADSDNYRIRKITKDGIIQTIAGTGIRGPSGDGGPALSANLDYIFDIAVTPDGGIYVPEPYEEAILRYIDPEGNIRKVGGVGFYFDESGMFGPSTNAWLYPFYVELGPDNNLYIPLQGNDASIKVIKSPLSGLSGDELLVPSADGSEVYKFTSAGKHLQTLNALTGAVLYEFAYDPEGRLASITDGDGNVTTIQRDGAGEPTGIVGPFGQLTTLDTDANGYLQTIANPAGESLQIQSSAAGLITQTTDPRGRISSYGYDDLGRLSSASDNASQNQTFARNSTGNTFQVSRTSGLGREVNYDVQRLPGQVQQNTNTAPDASESGATFDGITGVSSATSASGMTSTISERADPRFGMQAPLINTAEVSAPGGPTYSVSSTASAELSDPDDPFSLVSITGSATVNGQTTSSTYTAASKALVETSPGGRVSSLTIDDLGRTVSSQFGDLAPIIAVYNGFGQLETLTQGSGGSARVTSFTYGSDGFPQSTTDPLGRVASNERDAAGRITVKTLPGNLDVQFAYNAAGELESITPPAGLPYGFSYTLRGHLASVTPPTVAGSGPTTFAYNDDGQLTTISRPGNEGVSLDYDAEGRVQAIELIESGMTTTTFTVSYLTANQVDMISGPGPQTVSYGYQGDLVTSETWAGAVEGSVAWAYDNAFHLASENVAGGTAVAFGYDGDDLLTAAGAYSVIRNASNGLAVSASLGLVNDSWTYNEFGELESSTVMVNATTLYDASFVRDDLGRITQKVETIGGVSNTYDYDYDAVGQLTEVQKDSAVIESYSYDDNGNRLSATVDSVTSNASYDDQDRLLTYGGNSYTWTPAGRLATLTEPGDQVTAYDYDPADGLRGVTLPDAAEIAYLQDGRHRRVLRSIDGSFTHAFIYSGANPVAELDGLGAVLAQFVYAGGNVPVYMIKAGETYRLVTDQVGSVRLVVNAATGTIVQRLDYDSFGNVSTDTNPGFQPFGFAGGLYDAATGLLRFGARDYDALSGRWTAQDPVGMGGDDTNLYRYANNNPINLADPLGTNFLDKFSGFVNGLNEGLLKTINPALAVQSAIESLTDWMLGDWLQSHGHYRKPHPGMLFPPPAGANEQDYLDGHFYGECTADVATVALDGYGAVRGLARLGPSIAGKLGEIAGAFKRLPELFKGLGNAFGKGSKAARQLPASSEVDAAAAKFLKQLETGGAETSTPGLEQVLSGNPAKKSPGYGYGTKNW